MDPKNDLGDQFPRHPFDENGESDDVIVPAALNAMAVVVAELIHHAYDLEHFTVMPGIDEDNNYALQINADDMAEVEKPILRQICKDIEESGLVAVNHEANLLFDTEIEKFFVLYQTLAEFKGVNLDPLSEWYEPKEPIPESDPALCERVMTFIREETTALGYIHSDVGFSGVRQLVSDFMRSSYASNEGAFVPSYSLSALRTIVSLNGKKDENQPGVTALWLN